MKEGSGVKRFLALLFTFEDTLLIKVYNFAEIKLNGE